MPKADVRGADALVVSCEHATHHVPAAYRSLFRGQRRVLASHRGWDPGALDLARRLARRWRSPLVSATASRLLVDCNRSVDNPRLFSEFVRGLDDDARDAILRRYYLPHRARVESLVGERAAKGKRVLHLSVHTFTPVLRGVTRRADVGILYDPRRRFESALAREWRDALVAADSGLRVRLNYPYRGWTDGLTTTLRGRFADSLYAGIELEVNQAIVLGAPRRWRRVQGVLVESIAGVVF